MKISALTKRVEKRIQLLPLRERHHHQARVARSIRRLSVSSENRTRVA